MSAKMMPKTMSATTTRKKTNAMMMLKMTATIRMREDDDDSEDDGDDDRKESKAVKNARAAERKRCARIFGSKHAAANPSLAASLAFNTGMSSAAAINVLASTAPASAPAATRKRSLDQRMQESHQVRLNPDSGKKESGKSALVSKMTGLYNSTKERNNGSVWSECFAPGMKSSCLFRISLLPARSSWSPIPALLPAVYKRGTVLGMITASGKYTQV
jgi:hypothetical protein